MSAPVAIRACYSDLRLVKGRKVAVIYLEIPIEQAEQFVGAFGMPNPAEEKWVAIARLNSTAEAKAEPVEKERTRFSKMLPSAQAALRCKESRFRAFLRSNNEPAFDEEQAADCVRAICKVESRSELNANEEAKARWRELDDRYTAWVTAGV